MFLLEFGNHPPCTVPLAFWRQDALPSARWKTSPSSVAARDPQIATLTFIYCNLFRQFPTIIKCLPNCTPKWIDPLGVVEYLLSIRGNVSEVRGWLWLRISFFSELDRVGCSKAAEIRFLHRSLEPWLQLLCSIDYCCLFLLLFLIALQKIMPFHACNLPASRLPQQNGSCHDGLVGTAKSNTKKETSWCHSDTS